jgi:hypothetical protein
MKCPKCGSEMRRTTIPFTIRTGHIAPRMTCTNPGCGHEEKVKQGIGDDMKW